MGLARGFRRSLTHCQTACLRARLRSEPRPLGSSGQGPETGVLRLRSEPRPSGSGLRRNQRGLTLVELIVAFTIMLILSTMAVPLGRSKVRVTRERELRQALKEMHQAIDKYKDYADLGYLGPQKQGTNNWPETLEVLVEGVKLPGPDGKKMRFLRRIPVDPFTGKAEW